MHPPGFRSDHRPSDWPGCFVELRCVPCGNRSVTVPVQSLRAGGNPTFAELLPKLRCHKCGARAGPVYLCASQHRTFYGGPQPDWAIELVPAPKSGL